METLRMTLQSNILRCTLGLLLIGAAPLAGQDSCQPLNDAMSKVLNTPTHIYSSMSFATDRGNRPVTSETIYAAGSAYTKLNGAWKRSMFTPQQVAKREEENRRNSKTTCRYLKDESVDGETAAVYSTHSETDGQKSDGQIWISKTRGLPLRHEFDIIGGASKKDHHSTRYEYRNVQPPL
jgi:hypothetical protein